MTTHPDFIAAHPFSRDLDPGSRELLRAFASYRRFDAGETIFRENFEATNVYLLHSGEVSLQTFLPERGTFAIQTLGPKEVLGWSWLFPPFRWHLSAIATEPVEAAVLCAKTLRKMMEDDHAFGYAIAMRVGQVMFDRLQTTRQSLRGLTPAIIPAGECSLA